MLTLAGCSWDGWSTIGEILDILSTTSNPVVVDCNQLIVNSTGTTCNDFICDTNSGSCDANGCSCTMTGSISTKKDQ